MPPRSGPRTPLPCLFALQDDALWRGQSLLLSCPVNCNSICFGNCFCDLQTVICHPSLLSVSGGPLAQVAVSSWLDGLSRIQLWFCVCLVSYFAGATGTKTPTLGGRNSRNVLPRGSVDQQSRTPGYFLPRFWGRVWSPPISRCLFLATFGTLYSPSGQASPPRGLLPWCTPPSYKDSTQIGSGITPTTPSTLVPSERPYLQVRAHSHSGSKTSTYESDTINP